MVQPPNPPIKAKSGTLYRKALRNARAAYYSALIEENKNNPRFLFSTAARLTESHSSIEPHIPITLGSNDFMIQLLPLETKRITKCRQQNTVQQHV